MRFETAEIDRYGPLRGCRPPCDDGITVVAGPNESGKTLYLEAVLQLLESGVVDHMDPGPRVDQAPTGRVVVDDGAERHALGDGTGLSDVSRIEPHHLYNLFVVRDSDLVLPDGPDYYTTLVEHLGDIHTTAIEAMRAELVDEGRLTRSRLDLADREYDTKDVRNRAESLADEIEGYLETAEERGVGETVRERLQCRKDLATVESRVATQRTAERVANVEDASARLEEYVEATRALETLRGFDRETTTELREYEQNLEHARDDIEKIGSKLEAKHEETARRRERLADARGRHAELRQREGDVDDVEAALESYRDTAGDHDGEGFESRLRQRRRVTVAGLLGGGVAAGGGAATGSPAALVLGVVLLLVSAGGWYSHRRLVGRANESETLRRSLLQRARDAGFDVETPEGVAPRVRGYRDELDAAERRVRELRVQIQQGEERIDDLESNLEDVRTDERRLEDRLGTALAEHDVDSVDEFEARVSDREERERERSNAEPVLERALGEPESDDPAAKRTYWRSELDDREGDLGETDVDAEQYDEAELERLEERRAELDGRLGSLEDELEEYHAELESFERRATGLSPPPFVETRPSLQAHTNGGLRELADDLGEVVAEIERNAEVSRKAIGVLDEIKDDEEQKVATLFDPEGPASTILSHLTDGRYETVDYDPDAESLAVTTADGGTLTPHQLSRGTRDQLYFAARLSLAQQLLDGTPGFLLLDDPFLAADRTRLENGFETLQGLTNAGWQIVYLTAKREVHETMAESFDCAVHELEPLED